ncbi:MAG TPA: DUF4388 domain-containing protein [Acidimicrobiales bacterium]|nr:DUF4388 domain-containing protein [Acidimicrobiales bacterium]
MSLEGTLETIALPDVLALLSVTAKTGELRVETGNWVGSLWLDAGQVSGFQVGNNKEAVDALFTLLRLREGNFRFHAGSQPPNSVGPFEIGPVLEEAEARLMEWPSIAAAVPSLTTDLRLQSSIDEPVALAPDQWRLVATIGSGLSVGEVLDACGLGEFEGSKALKELVDLHVVDVVLPVSPDVGASHGSQADTGEYQVLGAGEDAEADADGDAEGFAAGFGGARRAQATGWDQGVRHAAAYEVVLAGDAAPDDAAAPQAAVPGTVATDDAEMPDVWREEGEEEASPAAEAPEEKGQPVNRGLLLKFLGSARN